MRTSTYLFMYKNKGFIKSKTYSRCSSTRYKLSFEALNIIVNIRVADIHLYKNTFIKKSPQNKILINLRLMIYITIIIIISEKLVLKILKNLIYGIKHWNNKSLYKNCTYITEEIDRGTFWSIYLQK